MEIIEITGDDLNCLLGWLGVPDGESDDIRRVSVTIDDGSFKFKVNGEVWSPPLGSPLAR